MIPDPLDFKDLQTYSVHGRHSKVTVEDFARPMKAGMSVLDLIQALPGQLAGNDFPELVTFTDSAPGQSQLAESKF